MKKPKGKSKRKVTSGKPQTSSLRIIAGEWGGRRLPFISAEGLRPSGDKVKERVFNWLMHDIDGAVCLDLFSGSGALGIEALSRHCQSLTFIDNNPATVAQLRDNLSVLGGIDRASIIHSDAVQWLENAAVEKPFDVIFLDPPFHQNLLPRVIKVIAERQWLQEKGWLYIELENEAGAVETVEELLYVVKNKSSGQVKSLLANIKTA